jgi:ABC-2 type transport system permease protein
MTHISPAIMVQFAMAGLIGSAEIVVLERRSRALRRMLTTAISRAEIILGHCLAMFVTILLQFVILIAFGQLVLGVDYLRAPLATLLMMATTALWAASLGMLIGALAKTDEQVVIFSLIPMFVLSGMGGAWVPLEVTGKTFQTIGHLLPTAWAIDGFENIVIRGLGLGSVLLPAGILLAYAALFFALAVWRFRFE